MYMDGHRAGAIYRRIIKHRALPLLFKSFVFAFAFVLAFDPLLQLASEAKLASYTSRIDSTIPRHVALSPYYQWVHLRGGLKMEAASARQFRNQLASAGGTIATDGNAKQRAEWVMRSWEQAAARPSTSRTASVRTASQSKKDSSQQALVALSSFPGLLLHTEIWRAATANKEICDRFEICKRVRQNNGLLASELETAIHAAIARSYFFFNYAIILLLLGSLAVMEFSVFSARRQDQV